jgi:protein-S-isoprenylcysteine O-methyltransferase Ste14
VRQQSAAQRVQLEQWIAKSQRTQKRVIVSCMIVLLISIALRVTGVVPSMIISVVMLFAVISGACGYWITATHIGDLRTKLG